MTAGDRHRVGTPFEFTETVAGTSYLPFPCVVCGKTAYAREGEQKPTCQVCLAAKWGVTPNVRGLAKRYTRLPGDTTPLRAPGVKELDNTYVPDSEPILREPIAVRRLATEKELPKGALAVYRAAIRHGWLVDITYAYGYPPNESLPVQSYVLRMTRGDEHAVGVWENSSVSTCYYWTGNEQPQKVTTTDLIGQRETEKRKFKDALLGDGRRDTRDDASPRIPRQREPADERVGPTVWAEVNEGDTVQGKGGSPWVVTRRRPDGRQIEITVRQKDGDTEVTASVKPNGPVHLLGNSVTGARLALEQVFGQVDPMDEALDPGVWIVERQIETCRQSGVGCGHEVCKWDAQQRRRRHR